MAKAEQK